MKPLFLIADDTPVKIDFLRRFVERMLDCEILTAATTDEAKELINEHVEIACAFVDYEMPSENGPAVIEALVQRNPNCLVALTSTSDARSYQRNALDAGAQTCICTSHALDEVEEDINMTLAQWKAILEQNVECRMQNAE